MLRWRHAPGGDVDLVDEDSGCCGSSHGGGEREERDGEDVVAADVADAHQEGCGGQRACVGAQRRSVWERTGSKALRREAESNQGATLRCLLLNQPTIYSLSHSNKEVGIHTVQGVIATTIIHDI